MLSLVRFIFRGGFPVFIRRLTRLMVLVLFVTKRGECYYFRIYIWSFPALSGRGEDIRLCTVPEYEYSSGLSIGRVLVSSWGAGFLDRVLMNCWEVLCLWREL